MSASAQANNDGAEGIRTPDPVERVRGTGTLADLLGRWPAALALGAVGGLLLWWPRSRRVLSAVAGCVLTRHRMRTALVELRLTSRAGWLPLLLWLVPSPVGERGVAVVPGRHVGGGPGR